MWYLDLYNESLHFINSLPNDKIIDESEFKAFADDNIILSQRLKFV